MDDPNINKPPQDAPGGIASSGPVNPGDTPPSAPPPFGAPLQSEVFGISAEGKSSPATTPPPPPPVPSEAVKLETVVVPPASPPEQNPFIPQGETLPPTPPRSGSPLMRRLLMIVVFLLFLTGLAFAGRFVWGLIAGTKEVTITYWGLWENDATAQSVIGAFESAHPKIKVQYVKQSPRQYRERLQAAIARGDGPDVFRFHNTWVAMLRNELALVPGTVMSPSEFSSTFYPVASADLVAGSNIFGIPIEIDGLGLYYNEDLFAAAGATPPTTWEDMFTLVPRLTVRNGDNIVTSAIALGTTGNVENFSDILAIMMLQNGAKLVSPTGTEAEETLMFYRKFSTPSDPVYTWNDSLDNSIYAFASGKVAMILAPSWRAFDIKQIKPDLRFKIAPIPQLPGNTVTWASYWVEGVSAKSKNQQAAWEFLKYLTGKEAVTMLYTEEAKTRLFGEPYARVDMASTIAQDPYAGAYVKQAKSAKSFPLASRTFDNGLNDRLIKYLEDAVNSVANDGAAPSAALSTAATGFSQVLSSYGLTSAAAPQTQQ